MDKFDEIVGFYHEKEGVSLSSGKVLSFTVFKDFYLSEYIPLIQLSEFMTFVIHINNLSFNNKENFIWRVALSIY